MSPACIFRDARRIGCVALAWLMCLACLVNEASAQPVSGPAVVDRSTLTGKVMCGYQGWFNCEGDGRGLGWTHWSLDRRRPPGPGNLHVDLWPDMSELEEDERYATDCRLADGSVAHVFSSANRRTVARHFRWMKDYSIDGVFLQRFTTGLRRAELKAHKDLVLQHVRHGAERYGRTFAVMYDLSSMPTGSLQPVLADWKDLQNNRRVTESPAYQYHAGKPLVAVWGVGFRERHTPGRYTLKDCEQLIRGLKSCGCAVMLGIPSGWRTGIRDAVDDPQLLNILQLADVLSPWTPGRYRNTLEATRHGRRTWTPDLSWCAERRIDFLPVVFPGFSWHNLKRGAARLDQIPRQQGQFLWSQIVAARQSGATMLYIAMFDEVDEATAIFKCTSQPPTADGVQLLNGEGLPSDHYLRIAGYAGRLLRDEISLSAALQQTAPPTSPSKSNRDSGR